MSIEIEVSTKDIETLCKVCGTDDMKIIKSTVEDIVKRECERLRYYIQKEK